MQTTDTLTVITTCPLCGANSEVTGPEQAILAWARGEMLIQDALPMLSLEERELLITGIDAACWESRFGGAE